MAKKKAAKSSNSADIDSDNADSPGRQRGFEELLGEVEQVVEDLETGDLSLDDSLKSYEKGVRSLRQCLQHLQKAERRIELLIGFDENGSPLSQPFDENAASLEDKQSSRGQRRGLSDSSSHHGRGTAANPNESDADNHLWDEDSSMDDSTGLF